MKAELERVYLEALGDSWRTIQAITEAMGRSHHAAGAISKTYGYMERRSLVEWRVVNDCSEYRITRAGVAALQETT